MSGNTRGFLFCVCAGMAGGFDGGVIGAWLPSMEHYYMLPSVQGFLLLGAVGCVLGMVPGAAAGGLSAVVFRPEQADFVARMPYAAGGFCASTLVTVGVADWFIVWLWGTL